MKSTVNSVASTKSAIFTTIFVGVALNGCMFVWWAEVHNQPKNLGIVTSIVSILGILIQYLFGSVNLEKYIDAVRNKKILHILLIITILSITPLGILTYNSFFVSYPDQKSSIISDHNYPTPKATIIPPLTPTPSPTERSTATFTPTLTPSTSPSSSPTFVAASTAQQTIQQFCTAVKVNDAQEAFSLLTPGQQQRSGNSKNFFVGFQEYAYGQCNPSPCTKDTVGASCNATLVSSQHTHCHDTFLLLQVVSLWKIDSWSDPDGTCE